MRIALDAGHGSARGRPSTGARGSGLVEDNLAFDFVTRIGHHLRAAGHKTVYTRPDSRLVSLPLRALRAQSAGCDLFISIHCNAGPSTARGAEAFVVKGDVRSRAVALRLLGALRRCGVAIRGAKWDTRSGPKYLTVLRRTYRHMPAVLLEMGFLSNAQDARLLADRFFREAAAVSIAEACYSSI